MTIESSQENPQDQEYRVSFIGIGIAVFLGAVVAWLGSFGSTRVNDLPVFALVIGWAFLLNWLVFIPAFLTHSEKFFDLTGALTYISATLAAVWLSGNTDLPSLIAAAVVLIWSSRLGIFLFRRIRRDGRDSRFDRMKYLFWRFLMTWTLQGLWVTLTACAAFVMITSEERGEFGGLSLLGLLIWFAGFTTEVIADQQKSRFKKNPDNKGRFISTGLWAYSRHPNYLGEILLWTGVLIMALPFLKGPQWFAIISPVFVYILLTKVSGIPLLKKQGLDRWGNDPEYQSYLRKTPLLFPRPFGKTYQKGDS